MEVARPEPGSTQHLGKPGGCIALIGDPHSAWDADDVGYFNRSAYELVLITGDLGGSQARDGLRVARSLSHMERRVLIMPGNNDVEEYPRIAAEVTYRRARADLLSDTPADAAVPRPGPELCGYSLHPVSIGGFELTVVAARPFAMGGSVLSFPQAVERNFGVRTMAESTERLKQLVDAVTTEHVVFLGHNGPTGLGGEASDPWGRDFDPDAGDWGDSDLRDAIDHAIARKLRPLAVVAGHMHWALRDPSASHLRRWQLQDKGVLYVNAARVPRIYGAGQGSTVHHHVSLRVGPNDASAEEILVSNEAS